MFTWGKVPSPCSPGLQALGAAQSHGATTELPLGHGLQWALGLGGTLPFLSLQREQKLGKDPVPAPCGGQSDAPQAAPSPGQSLGLSLHPPHTLPRAPCPPWGPIR